MKKILTASVVILITSIGAISCKKESNSPSGAIPLLSLSNNATIGGNILTDSSGRAVYNFIFDAKGQAACNAGCAIVWPHVYFPNLTKEQLGTGLNISDFSVATDIDGSMQTTYKGHPLYIYSNDAKTNGVWSVTGNNIEGGVWFAVQPDFTVFFLSPKKVGGDDITYLTTPQGIALYSTTASTVGSEWMPYKPGKNIINVPARLSASDFTINADGYLTYQGNILYTNNSDKMIGDTNGNLITGWSLVLIQ